MKTSLKYCMAVLMVCVFIYSSCKKKEDTAKDDTPPVHETFSPAVTAVGTDSGVTVSAMIDAAGGTIVSFDRRLEVIIPAGALSVATTITIQPVTNQCPGGTGAAYNLTPDSQEFLLPVTFRFHIDSADRAGTDMHALGIAYQQVDNIWYSFVSLQLDTAARTLSENSNHFSHRAMFKGLLIDPPHWDAQVNEDVPLKVIWWWKAEDILNVHNEQVKALGYIRIGIDPAWITWKVNNVTGGTANDGTVHPPNYSVTATYSAPPTAANMSVNPVTITALVDMPLDGKFYLVSEIKVDEARHYKVTFTQDFTQDIQTGSFGGYCNWAASGYVEKGYIYFYIESGSIITHLEQITNITPAYTFASMNGCTCTDVTFDPDGMMEFTSFFGVLENDSTILVDMRYMFNLPQTTAYCILGQNIVSDSSNVEIPETIEINLPKNNIPIVVGWNTLGSIIVKKL